MANSNPPEAGIKSKCLVCHKPIPEGAAICTECETFQFLGRRGLALGAKLAFVLVIPFAAWLIAYVYQTAEHKRAVTQATITRTAEQTAEVLELNGEFQVAFERLYTNCSKEAQAATNLCLAEYVERLIRLNELVSRFSWKFSALPMPEEAVKRERAWQELWWGTGAKGHADSAGGRLKRELMQMATKRAEAPATTTPAGADSDKHPNAQSEPQTQLLRCNALDFTDSQCGGKLQQVLGPFRGAGVEQGSFVPRRHLSHRLV